MKMIRRLLIVVILIIMTGVIGSFFLVSESTQNYPIKYSALIAKYSKENNIDPFLTTAVIRQESSFRPDVTSHMNAHGLMQLLPETAKWISERKGEEYYEEKLKDPEYNIRLGTYYLRYLTDYFGETQLVLAAYNGGLTNVNQWLNTPEYSKDGKHLDFIPFEETNHYVLKVTEYYKTYKDVYHDRFPEDSSQEKNPIQFRAENYKSLILRSAETF